MIADGSGGAPAAPCAPGAAPARRGRGRPPRIDTRAIADAALAVGFRDLTMPAVARRLGTGHSSLYRHVPDRDALVALAVDRLVELARWPPVAPGWRAGLEARGLLIWQAMEDNPGLDRAVAALTAVPPGLMARFVETVRALDGCGFPPDLAFLAADAVFDLAAAQFLQARTLHDGMRAVRGGTAAPPPAGPPGAVTRRPGIPAEFADRLSREVAVPPREWFERKLGLLLDGVERRLSGPGPLR